MRKLLSPCFLFLLGLAVGAQRLDLQTDSPGAVKRAGLLENLGLSSPTRLPDFVSLTKKLQPAVVNVSTTQKKAAPQFGFPMGAEGPLEELMPEGPGRQAPLPQQRNLGSGFIIAPDGLILTNYHVVENAEKITVQLSDKRAFEAKVVGKDQKTDVALIKIDAKGSLPTAPLGDSDQLEVGEWVLAMGNPFGLDNSVTSGIVSAKGRHIGAGPYDSFIQTDAPINPGNSGGPLVNLRGEVIGINMAIVSQTGGNIGIGFATPINLVKDFLPQLKTAGKVTRGWVGLAIQPLTPEMAQSLGLEKPQGALVVEVVKSGPADEAGIRKGDIVTEYDGRAVSDAGGLPIMVARTQIGKKVQIKVRRGKQTLPLTVTVRELREQPPAEPAKEVG
ncbi:MAG TPA: Do family serine endopeptidase [Candidatus Acidoferrales bacterium]|nr:Do family serine endopeptidase [Candidatus Acidoferrales bacterium]